MGLARPDLVAAVQLPRRTTAGHIGLVLIEPGCRQSELRFGCSVADDGFSGDVRKQRSGLELLRDLVTVGVFRSESGIRAVGRTGGTDWTLSSSEDPGSATELVCATAEVHVFTMCGTKVRT